MVPLLFLCLLQNAPPPTRWPLESIVVEGLDAFSQQEIVDYSGLRIGAPAGKEEFEAARRKLMATGWFAGAGYGFKPTASGRGIAGTLELQELAQKYPVRFERLDASDADMTGCLRQSDPLFRTPMPASPPLLEKYARAIEACLAARQHGAEVSGRLWPDRDDELSVLFAPAARAPAIAQVQFAGTSAIAAATLQTAVSPVAIGAAFDEAGFQKILDATVRRLYDSKGMIRVAFPKVTSAPAEGVDGVAVFVEVVEGDVFTLDGVRFEPGGLSTEEMAKAAAVKTGQAADFDEIDAGLQRLKAALHRAGYLKAEPRVERNVRDAEKKVDLVVYSGEGRRFVMDKLIVEGLSLDGEAQIRRLWALKAGAPFNTEYPDFFLSRIREDGVFDNLGPTKAEAKLDEGAHTVNVTLRFGRK